MFGHDLHGRVAQQLATAILRGGYAPETILPREAELMETFGVSRTVLREALRTLTSKGLIESRPRVGKASAGARGTCSMSTCSTGTRGSPSRWRSRSSCRRIARVARPYAAALAAASHTADTFSALDAAHAAMVAARNVDEWVRADLRFHISVLAACSNELLIPLGTLIERTLEAQLRLNAKRAEVYNASLAEHTAVFDAIRARDAVGAQQAMAGLLGVTPAQDRGVSAC